MVIPIFFFFLFFVTTEAFIIAHGRCCTIASALRLLLPRGG
jgi:hypothetical protein